MYGQRIAPGAEDEIFMTGGIYVRKKNGKAEAQLNAWVSQVDNVPGQSDLGSLDEGI